MKTPTPYYYCDPNIPVNIDQQKFLLDEKETPDMRGEEDEFYQEDLERDEYDKDFHENF